MGITRENRSQRMKILEVITNYSMKKKQETNLDVHSTIVYKANHNHPKPQSTWRSSSSSLTSNHLQMSEVSSNHEQLHYRDQSYGSNGFGNEVRVGLFYIILFYFLCLKLF